MKDRYLAFLNEPPSLATLKAEYPELHAQAQAELSKWATASFSAGLQAAVEAAHAHQARIQASGLNAKVLEVSFPKLVRARILVLLLKNYNLYARTGRQGRIRFNAFNGTMLQRILFYGSGFERKPVSLFWYSLWWPWLTQKRFLMPLVNQKGIYCFYSRALVRKLAGLLAGQRAIEVAAGDGTFSRFLRGAGIDIRASDDQSWNAFVTYPADVEDLDAGQALAKYQPEAVVCSWPPTGNSFEAKVFEADSVKLYVVIGGPDAGNLSTYAAQTRFDEVLDSRLSALVLPREEGNTVRVFRRKSGT